MKHSVEIVTLKNGAKGLLINIPGATVMSTRVAFRAGLRYAKKSEIAEIAHIVEHLSFGANSKYKDEQAYEAEFTKNGAYHNAWTSDEFICYETECADFEWERILNLKRLAICQPNFNDDELRSEKANIRSELTAYQNEYYRLVWPKIQQGIGQDIPTVQERIRTINNVTLRDIREHYRRTHTSNNMRFIIAGNLIGRKRKIKKILETWELNPGERLPAPTDEFTHSEAQNIRRKDASNITFGFTFVTPRRLNPIEQKAMECLSHIFTGTMSSRIFGAARKNGLAYSLLSTITNETNYSSLDFEGEVNLENATDLFSIIHKEISRVLNGDLEDKDLEAAKSYLLGRFQMSAESVSKIADYYAETFFRTDEPEKISAIPHLLKSVNKSTIINLTREYIDSDISSMAAVSSSEKARITELQNYLDF